MPNQKPRAVVAWSSGKDSAWALWRLQQRGELEVIGLLTTLNEADDAVAMHAVPRALLRAQAAATGLPLHEVELPWPCPNEVYEQRMGAAVTQLTQQGATHMVFGDLFLEDIRRYREDKLAGSGLQPLFPLWGENTRRLAQEMIEGGLKATLVCVDTKQAPADLAGRAFDQTLLQELPLTVDPCGERGEFHSFVTAGPMLRQVLTIKSGAVVTDQSGYARVTLELSA